MTIPKTNNVFVNLTNKCINPTDRLNHAGFMLRKFLPLLIFATGTLIANTVSVPIGEHPRVLFTKSELPEIRERADTPEGKRLVGNLESEVKRWVRDFDLAFPKDGSPADEARLELVGRLRNGKLPYFDDIPYRSGLLAQLTDDPEHRRWAANYLRGWLLSLVPENGIIKESESWGHPRLALAYDLVYRDLTEQERQLARDLISARGLSVPMQKSLYNKWYVWGPNRANGSQSNWDCIYASNTLLSLMAIEGEESRFPVDPAALTNSVQVLRSFLLDGITAYGAFYDGLTYPHGYGTHFMPHALLGLKLRGIDAAEGTNVTKPGFWLTYEMLPWGGEGQPMNKSDGHFSTDTMFPTWLALHGGEMARWHFLNTSGAAYDLSPRMSPEIALVNGIPEITNWTPEELPLAHWFSVVGKVISRGGWEEKDSHFVLSANPISTGHSHADNGQICFADRGVNFFADSSTSLYTTDEHNLVLIDGKGQSRDEGSVEGYIRYAEFSDYADASDVDLEESYTRFISGALDGPWHYENYNPVQSADRRTLFIRGASGTILAVADDIQKDEEPHDYQLRLHSEKNNLIKVKDRSFTITERYGGQVLQSAGPWQECLLTASDVPAGRYRCWALVRGLPKSSRSWSNTQIHINGKGVNYTSTYFALGNFRGGWRWQEIRMGGAKADPWMELPAGELEVKLTGKTGSQVGMFIFSSRDDWEPGFDYPQQTEPGVIVLNVTDAIQGDKPWTQFNDPKAQLQAFFLGRNTPALTVQQSSRTGQPRVLADLRTTHWQSVFVATTDELPSQRETKLLGNNTIRYRLDQSTDYVSVGDDDRISGEILETDGVIASASLPEGTLAQYALLNGKILQYEGIELVNADQPVTLLSDGNKVIIRAPGGTSIAFRRLSAETLWVNGEELPLPSGEMAVVNVPKLPDTWKIEYSQDGRRVTVTGDGPWPLKIHAPEARELIVNGVRRHFIRSERQKGEGWIWPYMESMPCWQYAGEVGSDTLVSWMVSGDGTKARIPGTAEDSLKIEHNTTLQVPLSGPADYEMMLRVHAIEDMEILLRAGDATKSWKLQGGGTSGKTFTGFSFTGEQAELLLMGTAPFFLKGISMKPQLTLLTPTQWAIIGPFPAGSQTGNDIKKAMDTAFVPEDGSFDAADSFTGENDQSLRWIQGEVLADANDYKFSMWSKQLGFKNNGIAYAVTFIDSPTERSAHIGIKVDYWANAWLNGEKVISERPRNQVDRDGCEFNNALIRAHIRLKKGRNVLMIKVRGGNGSNAFSGYITDPGDLRVTCPLE